MVGVMVGVIDGGGIGSKFINGAVGIGSKFINDGPLDIGGNIADDDGGSDGCGCGCVGGNVLSVSC